MKDEYKVLIALGVIVCIVFGLIFVYDTGLQSKTGNGRGFFGLFGADDDYGTGISLNTNYINYKNTGVSGWGGVLKQDAYAGVHSVNVVCDGAAKINWNRQAHEFWIPGPLRAKIAGYWYTVNWKEKGTSWATLIGRDTTRSFSGGSIKNVKGQGYHELDPPFSGGPTAPPHYFYADIPLEFDAHFGDNFKGIAIQTAMHIHLVWDGGEVRDFICTVEEAYVISEEIRLTVHTTPAFCDVTVGKPTGTGAIDKQTGNSGAQGVISFTVESGWCFATVECEGYTSKTETFEIYTHKSITINLVSEVEDTYTLTVTTDPNLCEVYLNGMYKNSLYDGQAVFRNINRGTYTLVVKRGGYSLVTQTITMDRHKEISVSLERGYVPPPVNTPPVAYTPESMDDIGAIGETYEFYVDGYDADGDSLTYRIDWGDGTKSTWSSATFYSHSWNKPGSYGIKVKAYDGIDYSEWSSPLYFTVKKEINAAPTVVLYGPASGNIGSPGISYTFTAYGYDAEGASLRYKFDWGDGTSTRWTINRMVKKTYYSAGIFTVKVQAYDGERYSDYATLTFQAGIGRLPAPTIMAYDCERGRTNTVVIRVITTLDKDVFDLYGFVKDTSGIIIKWTALRKSFSGDGYIATMSFTCNVLGDVTISAKAGPTRGVSGYLSSDVVTKTIQCVITPEEREEEEPWEEEEEEEEKKPWEREEEEIEEEPPYAPPVEYRYREVPGFELIIFFIAAIVVVMLYKKKRMDGR